MRIPIYHVDAFARAVFTGNPAAVCPLEGWIYDATLQAIAAENGLPDTAFVVPRRGEYELRCFSPTVEVALCGHATLAAGWAVLTALEPRRQSVAFHSRAGELVVSRDGDRLALTLPRHDPAAVARPASLDAALGRAPLTVLGAPDLYLCVYDDALAVAELTPDFAGLAAIDRAVAVTAPGGAHGCDFVSRVFTPRDGVPEDPVTGSAHCALAPYWAAQLKRDSLFAKQISKRGGEIWCRIGGGEVTLGGSVVPYFVGELEV